MWCENVMNVTGSKTEIKQIADKLKERTKEGEQLTLNNIMPSPKSDSVQHWKEENWGTRTGAVDEKINISFDKNRIVARFFTAFHPPTKLIIFASKSYPELNFNLKYYESKQMRAGQIIFEGGEIIYEEIYDAKNEKKLNFIRFIAKNFDKELSSFFK